MSEPRTVLLVTGSGRSGTSSVAGTLQRLGAHIPEPQVPTDHNNPRGYYEAKWVIGFHLALMRDIPVRSIDARPSAGDLAMAAVTPEVEQRLRTWLDSHVDTERPLVLLKDPRACWVHDLWSRVCLDLGIRLTSLTMLRHPAQVVRSRDTAYLADRDDRFRHLRETTNVAAWVNAALHTERVTRGQPRAFVPYLDLLDDWRTTIGRVRDQLGLSLDVPAPGSEHPVDDFLTPGLNRSAVEWEGLSVPPSVIDLAERVWTTTQELVADPRRHAPQQEADGLLEEYRRLHDLAEAVAFDDTQAEVHAVRRRLRARLTRKDERIEKLKARLNER